MKIIIVDEIKFKIIRINYNNNMTNTKSIDNNYNHDNSNNRNIL